MMKKNLAAQQAWTKARDLKKQQEYEKRRKEKQEALEEEKRAILCDKNWALLLSQMQALLRVDFLALLVISIIVMWGDLSGKVGNALEDICTVNILLVYFQLALLRFSICTSTAELPFLIVF